MRERSFTGWHRYRVRSDLMPIVAHTFPEVAFVLMRNFLNPIILFRQKCAEEIIESLLSNSVNHWTQGIYANTAPQDHDAVEHRDSR